MNVVLPCPPPGFPREAPLVVSGCFTRMSTGKSGWATYGSSDRGLPSFLVVRVKGKGFALLYNAQWYWVNPDARARFEALRACQEKGEPKEEHIEQYVDVRQDRGDFTPVVTGCPRRDDHISHRKHREWEKRAKKERASQPITLDEQEEEWVGEERPKGHDEVAPVGEDPQEGELHGGDGNSGECDSAAETSSNKPRQTPPDSGGSPSEEGGCTSPSGEAGNQDQNGQGDPGSNEPNEGPAQPQKGGQKQEGSGLGTSSTSDDPAREEQACTGLVEDPTSKPGHPSHTAEVQSRDVAKHDHRSAEVGDSPLRTGKSRHGGNCLSAVDPKDADRRGAGTSAKRVLNLLQKLVEASDAGGTDGESSRWSGRKLVTELATSRYAMGRAKRTETLKARFILAVDVSGSCSNVCDAAWRSLLAIADQDPRVILVKHSNGFLFEGSVVTRTPLLLKEEGANLDTLIEETQKLERVKLLVNVGDLDAYDSLLLAAKKGAKVIHLDNYMSRQGSVCLMKRAGTEDLREAGVICIQGVSNKLPALEIALRLALKSR